MYERVYQSNFYVLFGSINSIFFLYDFFLLVKGSIDIQQSIENSSLTSHIFEKNYHFSHLNQIVF